MSDISRGSLSESPAKLDERDIDVLLDQYANALLLHRGDRHQVEGCEACKTVRIRIKRFVEEARQEGVRAVQLDKARGIWPPIREADQTIGSHLNFDRTDD